MSSTVDTTTEIQSFQIEIPDEQIDDLRQRVNALPQYTTVIDGVEIHFIHVRSRHENALPMIMTHGWPGRGPVDRDEQSGAVVVGALLRF